jgi:tight adherence protein C
MITAVLLGAGAGVGIWLIATWAFPTEASLRRVLGQLNRAAPVEPVATIPAEGLGWAARLGRPAAQPLRRMGLPDVRRTRDLAITGTDADSFLAEKAALGLFGLLAPAAAATLLALFGDPVVPTIPVALALGGGLAGFLAPDLRLRREAARRRSDFHHALSAYLDLVVISLFGGAGIDGALADAVSVGDSWSFRQISRALDTAQLTRTTPWVALGNLGAELNSRELAELAASLSLAGTEGAKVRTSLAARAHSLRTHLLTDADASARAATERMGLAWGLLFLGFLIFIGYPAMQQILTGL